MEKINEKIRRLRKEKNLSQDKLASLVGYSDRSVISRIEKGEIELSQSKLIAFAEVLGVTPLYLLNEKPLSHQDRLVSWFKTDLAKKGYELINANIDNDCFVIKDRWGSTTEVIHLHELEEIYDRFSDNTSSYIVDKLSSDIKSSVPLLGTICAGDGIWAEENFEDYIKVDDRFKVDFALKVKGNSMKDANINDGDIAFFKKQSTVDDGQIAAVLLTDCDEATLKRVYRTEEGLTLRPCNSDYDSIHTKEAIILGLLKGVYSER